MLSTEFFKRTKGVWLLPILLITGFFIGHLFFIHYGSYLNNFFLLTPNIYLIENYSYLVLMAVCGYWLGVRLINTVFSYFQNSVFFQQYPTISMVMPFLNAVLKGLTFLIVFNFLTQNLKLPTSIGYALNKISSVMIICTIGWLLLKLIDVAEKLLLHRFSAEISGINTERKVYTQTLILKRVAYSIVSILTAGAVLVLFDNVRALGASVLTTAGVVGLILTFTAQRSLASIFSGLEIALTQPIKIGDSVVIDSEFGIIEEINFRSVVVKLWDWRRLVVPTSFFLEKTFQNWNRVQDTNLIGTILFSVDFTLPVSEARNHLKRILQDTPYWDKNVGILQVSELQERVMQIKILASSHNADDLSNLRAFIREEMIKYIVQDHPYALPKTRSFTQKNDIAAEIFSMDKKLEEAYP